MAKCQVILGDVAGADSALKQAAALDPQNTGLATERRNMDAVARLTQELDISWEKVRGWGGIGRVVQRRRLMAGWSEAGNRLEWYCWQELSVNSTGSLVNMCLFKHEQSHYSTRCVFSQLS